MMLVGSGCAPTVDDVGGWAELSELGVLGVLPRSSGEEAYLCGTGEQTDRSQWLPGSDAWQLVREGDTFTLSGPDEDWSGTLTPFDEGGLYEASPDGCRSGAVLYDGELAGTWCGGSDELRQVEPIETVTGGPSTISVRLVDDASYTFQLKRLL
ncbi:MAG: hypothetical protein ACI8S6_001205 [Myxococcota bacterium]|jgi:hypothetical protein